MRNRRGLSFAPRAVKASFNASVLSANILTLPSLSCLTMSTEGTRKETESGETSKDSSTATGAISKDILKDALKEVLAENPSLLATTRRPPDDDPSKSKENSSSVAYFLVQGQGSVSPPSGACNNIAPSGSVAGCPRRGLEYLCGD